MSDLRGAKLRIYRSAAEIESIACVWDSFRSQEPRFIPSFATTKKAFQDNGLKFCFIALEDDCSIKAVACFFSRRSAINVSIGGRLLFGLPIRETRLCYSAILGRVDSRSLKDILRSAAHEWPFDLIVLAEVESNSPLFRAARTLRGGLVPTRPIWNHSAHWLVNLPRSFEEYLKSLRSTTRKKILQTIRTFERHGQFQLQIVNDASHIDKFLKDGEEISRRTYQWDVAQRLQNDDETRERYLKLAREHQLRCYILYIDNVPCAFARGEMSGTLYHYETPGFDPAFRKLSPGIVLLMWVIRDLIENTECQTFDFGSGGGPSGYKGRFSNYHFECDRVDICSLRAPYSLFIFVVQRTIHLLKRMLDVLLG